MLRKNTRMAVLLVLTATASFGQSQVTTPARNDISPEPDVSGQRTVVITGARFSYPLLQKWIEDYGEIAPDVKVIIEPRANVDPEQYDILAEVVEHDQSIKSERDYIYVGRYAILPVSNSSSSFAKVYKEKGLTSTLINYLFFEDIFSANERENLSDTPFTVYTRLQKAGAPAVFANYFGHEQKDIRGIAIAGSDAHLLKAVLSDSTGVTYLPLPLIYDQNSRRPLPGLTVLPVDVNGNKRLSEGEKFYDSIDGVIEKLEEESGYLHNVPLGHLHLSIDKQHPRVDAVEFLNWVRTHGERDLHTFGFLKPASQNQKLSRGKEPSKGRRE